MKARKFIALACMLFLIIQIQPADAKVKKVSLNKSNVTIKTGKTLKLKLKNCDKKIKWSCDDINIATVSQKGKVCAKGLGTTVVKATVGKKTYKCKLTVRSSISAASIKLDYKNTIFTEDIYRKVTSIRFGNAEPAKCPEVTDTAAIKKIFSMFTSLELHETDTPKGIFAGEIIFGKTPSVYFIFDDKSYIKFDPDNTQAEIQNGSINTKNSLFTPYSTTLYEIDSFQNSDDQVGFWDNLYKLFDQNKQLEK